MGQSDRAPHITSYITQCVNTMQSIDPRQFNQLKQGEQVGADSSALAYAIGSVTLGPEQLSLCVKVPRPGHRSSVRLITELTAASVIAYRAPELAPLLPRFMGLLSVGDQKILVTEDLSRAGTLAVTPQSLSMTARRQLQAVFRDTDNGTRDVLLPKPCDETLAFTVNGSERLLGLSPSPILQYPKPNTRFHAEVTEARMYAYAQQDQLTQIIEPLTVPIEGPTTPPQ